MFSNACKIQRFKVLVILQVAQAILLPFLVDKNNVGDLGMDAVHQIISMSPPENRRVSCNLLR